MSPDRLSLFSSPTPYSAPMILWFLKAKWNPILCALKLNRAALDVHWSPSGKAQKEGVDHTTHAIGNVEVREIWRLTGGCTGVLRSIVLCASWWFFVCLCFALLFQGQQFNRRYASFFFSGTKFACSSGAKTIAVSRLDRSQGSDWYVSTLIKGHKSTVSEARGPVSY